MPVVNIEAMWSCILTLFIFSSLSYLSCSLQLVLDGALLNRVKVEDSMWNVDRESSTLCINLEKTKEIMWKSVLEGEEGIDLTKVCVCVCVCVCACKGGLDQRAVWTEKKTADLPCRWTTLVISVSLMLRLRLPSSESLMTST